MNLPVTVTPEAVDEDEEPPPPPHPISEKITIKEINIKRIIFLSFV